jgi:hypothetical protein
VLADAVLGTVPGLQRIIPLRFMLAKTGVNALMLRCARDTFRLERRGVR